MTTKHEYTVLWPAETPPTTPNPRDPMTQDREAIARELLAAEMKAEWLELYRDRESGEPPSEEIWLQRAANAPASIRAIEKALTRTPTGEWVEALRLALGEAAFTFETYERLHKAKGTPEGYEKAAANAKMAAKCHAALEGSSLPISTGCDRERVIEECAKVAEKVGECANTRGLDPRLEELGEDIADAIRSLIPPPSGGVEG